MPKRNDIQSILIIGAVCEFDLSSAQPCKALTLIEMINARRASAGWRLNLA